MERNESISSVHDEVVVVASRSFSSDPIGPELTGAMAPPIMTSSSSSPPDDVPQTSSSPVQAPSTKDSSHVQASAGFVLDADFLDGEIFSKATSLRNNDAPTSPDSDRHRQHHNHGLLSSWSTAFTSHAASSSSSDKYTDARSSPQLDNDGDKDKKSRNSNSPSHTASRPSMSSPFSVTTAPFYPSLAGKRAALLDVKANIGQTLPVDAASAEMQRAADLSAAARRASQDSEKDKKITELTYEVTTLKTKNEQLEGRLNQMQAALSVLVSPQQPQGTSQPRRDSSGHFIDDTTSLLASSPVDGAMGASDNGSLQHRPRRNSDLHATRYQDFVDAAASSPFHLGQQLHHHQHQQSRRPSQVTLASSGIPSSTSSSMLFGTSPDASSTHLPRDAFAPSNAARSRFPSTTQHDANVAQEYGTLPTQQPGTAYHANEQLTKNTSDDYGNSHSPLNPYLPSTFGGNDRAEQGAVHSTDLPAGVLVHRVLLGRSQEPSITLQHQLKLAGPARRNEIITAMTPHLAQLADDKHGNFLVQRAITAEPNLAWQLCGHFASLSLSPFGCHVVQTVLQHNEGIRSSIVKELLGDRLYQTFTCRHSIHVWQQIFEMQWKDGGVRGQIFSSINDTMRGRWAATAMLEAGSIMCQNIFESAHEAEKHECLEEILAQLCACAANQWGVWVVQHIIEHGDESIKLRALKQLLQDPVPLCLSPFGQKAVMSALKSGSTLFLDGFIDVLCEREGSAAVGTLSSSSSGGSLSSFTGPASSLSRRSNLVEVATASTGLQIITQLITSVNDAQRELIIRTVRRNSVFLKGSKTGLKVHQMCERARAYKGY